jgi:hypothetical protein
MVAQTDVPESDPKDYYSYLAFARLFGELDILRTENPLLSKHACTGRNTLKLEFIRAELAKQSTEYYVFGSIFLPWYFFHSLDRFVVVSRNDCINYIRTVAEKFNDLHKFVHSQNMELHGNSTERARVNLLLEYKLSALFLAMLEYVLARRKERILKTIVFGILIASFIALAVWCLFVLC